MNSPLFQSHKLNAAGLKAVEQITESFNHLLEELSEICLPSREFAIVCTKLEEASFFAKKSVSNQLSKREQ